MMRLSYAGSISAACLYLLLGGQLFQLEGVQAESPPRTLISRESTSTRPKKKPLVDPAPIIVGEVRPLISDYKYASQIRLPWMVTTIVGDYCINSGICHFFRDQVMDPEDTLATETSYATPDGAFWYLQGPTDIAINNLHYLFSENQATHSKLRTILAQSGFQTTLDSIGAFFGLETLQIYSMGFIGATYSQGTKHPTNLNSHLLPRSGDKARTFQVVIPMDVKETSRPELQLNITEGKNSINIKVKSEMDMAWILGDVTSYGPETFDYRDSPEDMYLAFSLYLVADSDSIIAEQEMMHLPKVAREQFLLQSSDSAHWNQDGSGSLSHKDTPPAADENVEGTCVATEQEECVEEPSYDWKRKYNWYNWTLWDFKFKLGCSEFYDATDREPPQADYWRSLRRAYTSIVGSNSSTLVLPLTDDQDGYNGKVEAKKSPGKGRGVFAKEFIPKGTLVYQSLHQARFSNGTLYKQFLMSVSVEAACDLLMWSTIQEVVLDGVQQPPTITVDLDNGSLVNGGDRTESMTQEEKEETEEANVGCIPEAASNGKCENDFALRDIQAGEEILIDYTEYSDTESDVWMSFGLGDPAKGEELLIQYGEESEVYKSFVSGDPANPTDLDEGVYDEEDEYVDEEWFEDDTGGYEDEEWR